MRIGIFRRAVQIATIALIVLIPVLNKKGITVIAGTLYSLAAGPVWITDPLSGVQVIITTLAADKQLLLSLIIPVVFAFVFGRAFCGWFCPQNTISEFFDYLSSKAGIKRLFHPKPSAIPGYAVLIVLLLLTFMAGIPLANLVSAPGIISVQAIRYVYENALGIELGLIGIIVLSEAFLVRRLWCKYLCPQGSLLGIFRSGKTMKVVFKEDEKHACKKCFECVKACQFGLNPVEGNIYPLCTNCGECVAACERMEGKGKTLSFRW